MCKQIFDKHKSFFLLVLFYVSFDQKKNFFCHTGFSALESIDQLLEDFGVYVFVDRIAKQLAKHPFLAFGASALIISVTLPFIIFMVFAIGTVILTFFGFVIVEGMCWKRILRNYFVINRKILKKNRFRLIEGTLITIASVLLFGFLGAVVIMFLLFGSVLMAGYFGFMQIYDLFYPKSLYIKFRQPHRHNHAHLHHHTVNTRTLDGHGSM